MRVFLSFALQDARLAAQLEAVLKRHKIETVSSLDLPSGEEWKRVVDQQAADADGFIFLLGSGASVDPGLQAEWRSFLRNDWDSKMPLVPVVHLRGAQRENLPPFLRNRKAIYTSNFDDLVADQVRTILENPVQSASAGQELQSRKERESRLDDLKNYALSLKEHPGPEASRE